MTLENNPERVLNDVFEKIITASLAEEEREWHDPFVPFAAHAEQLQLQCKEMVQDYVTRLKRGVELLKPQLEEDAPDFTKQLQEMEKQKSKEPSIDSGEKEGDSREVKNPYGFPIFQFSDEQLERYYSYANDLYVERRYDEAADILFVLTVIDPLKRHFWMALAMCEQQLTHYHAAVIGYYHARLLDAGKPDSYLYMSYCFKALEDKDSCTYFLKLILDDKEAEQNYPADYAKAKALFQQL